jgi:DNA repair protein RecO (recombination protein O)
MIKGKLNSNGFVIQKQPFRNNSLLLTVIDSSGQLFKGLLYNGQKKYIQPFQPYYFVLNVKPGLSLFEKIEVSQPMISLQAENLYCAMYLNELIGRLGENLKEADGVYSAYHQTLLQLSKTKGLGLEWCLRKFELFFLNEIGFGFDFSTDNQGQAIKPQANYQFDIASGIWEAKSQSNQGIQCTGEALLALANDDLTSAAVLALAKKINRQRIQQLLNGKPLISRSFFESASS